MMNKLEAERIVLEYNLYDLPTAQHKAGLIGLLLMIESMKMRRMEHVPDVECEATWAKISFTEESMQALFDDLYKGEKITTKKGDDKTIPSLDYLSDGFSFPDVWVKAWRECIGSVVRKGAALGVYERGYPAKKEFEMLVKNQCASSKFDASLVFAGEQRNAELVSVRGLPKNNFLLHFCLIPSLLFVPTFLVKDPVEKKWKQRFELSNKRRGPFFTIVIPEPSSLKYFIQDVKDMLRSLSPEIVGYRPKDALIYLPEEGGLEYLHHLARSRVEEREISDTLVAIDIYAMEKRNNQIVTLSAPRILPEPEILNDYEALRNECRNPLFKSQRIRNLLTGNSWYHGMNALLNRYPYEFFIRTSDTPSLPFFGHDVQRKFSALNQQAQFKKGGVSMKDETSDDHLALCVHRLIREYVNRRTEKKSGVNWKELKKQQDDNRKKEDLQKYFEAREKVCSDAFLAMRGRKDQAYLEYFTGTICSVPQYLPEDDYLVVSQALLTDWERVKTLAMLALSAVSAVAGSSKQKEKGGEGQ